MVLLFFPPPKKQQKQNKRSRYWVERVGQCHPRFPVSGNSFVLGLLLSCWIPAPAGQSDYRGVYVEVCFWDVCPVLKVVYFSPAPGSLTKTLLSKPPSLALSEHFILNICIDLSIIFHLLKNLLAALKLCFQSPL